MSLATLNSLNFGEVATIIEIHAEEALRLRLQALGFRNGKQIAMIRKASFSGPLQVRIGTTDVMLRRIEAEKITVNKT
jgi:ferrous iron transport protein A